MAGSLYVRPSEDELDLDGRLCEFNPYSLSGSVSTSVTSNLKNSSKQLSVDENETDLLERLFYRTTKEDSKTTLQFISNVFFSMLLSKCKADFSSNIDIDETTFITKCVTHVQGLIQEDLFVHKNSKGGATVQNLIDEVPLYDMKAFSAVI